MGLMKTVTILSQAMDRVPETIVHSAEIRPWLASNPAELALRRVRQAN